MPLPVSRQRIDEAAVPRHPRAQGRPGVAVTFGNAPCRHTPRGTEAEGSPGVEIGPARRQRIDIAAPPRPQGRPGAAVPFGDVVGRHRPNQGEVTSDIHIAATVRRDGGYGAIGPRNAGIQAHPVGIAEGGIDTHGVSGVGIGYTHHQPIGREHFQARRQFPARGILHPQAAVGQRAPRAVQPEPGAASRRLGPRPAQRQLHPQIPR